MLRLLTAGLGVQLLCKSVHVDGAPTRERGKGGNATTIRVPLQPLHDRGGAVERAADAAVSTVLAVQALLRARGGGMCMV